MNINEMIKAMVQAQVEQAIKEALGDMLGTPEVASAEVEAPVKSTSAIRKLTAEDLAELDEVHELKTSNAELGYWEGMNKDGNIYHWFGWADPNTGRKVFPGKQLYHVNDFYLKRDYNAYHPGKTTSYKFKNGGLHAAISQYKVRTEVEPEDAKAFLEFMKAKEDKAAERAHDTDIYTDWCKTSRK